MFLKRSKKDRIMPRNRPLGVPCGRSHWQETPSLSVFSYQPGVIELLPWDAIKAGIRRSGPQGGVNLCNLRNPDRCTSSTFFFTGFEAPE